MSLAPPDDGPCNRRTKPRWPDQRDPRWRIRRRPRSWRAEVEFRERELRAATRPCAVQGCRSERPSGRARPRQVSERGGVRFVATETIAEASITKCHARSSRCGYRATRQVHATERSLSTSWMAAVLLTPWRRASSLGRRRSSGLMLRDRRAALSTFAMRSTHIVAGPER